MLINQEGKGKPLYSLAALAVKKRFRCNFCTFLLFARPSSGGFLLVGVHDNKSGRESQFIFCHFWLNCQYKWENPNRRDAI